MEDRRPTASSGGNPRLRTWRKDSYGSLDSCHSESRTTTPRAYFDRHDSERSEDERSREYDLMLRAFCAACACEHHTVSECYVVRSALCKMTRAVLDEYLPLLECAECWRELIMRAHERYMRSCDYEYDYCVSFHGYRAIDERILTGHTSAYGVLRAGFLGACARCDNIRALRIYLRMMLDNKRLMVDNEEIAQVLRDGARAAYASPLSTSDVSDFIAMCYFPHRARGVWARILEHDQDGVPECAYYRS